MLLSHGADASIVDADGKVPLHHAGLSGNRLGYDILCEAYPSAAALADFKVHLRYAHMQVKIRQSRSPRAFASVVLCIRLHYTHAAYTSRASCRL